MEHTYLLCLGTNQDALLHLKQAETAIASLGNAVQWGEIIVTPAEGGRGMYHNRAVRLRSALSPEELREQLKQIEREAGRTAESKLRGIIPLDIDVLACDGEVLRPDDWEKEYVKLAMSRLV